MLSTLLGDCLIFIENIYISIMRDKIKKKIVLENSQVKYFLKILSFLPPPPLPPPKKKLKILFSSKIAALRIRL